VFRLICLNNVIKRYIYTKNIFNPSPQVRWEASKSQRWLEKCFYPRAESVYENFIRTFNAVIAKYALLSKPRSGRGGKQSAPQNGTAEAQ
jgi:hypothetical protein